MKCVLVPGLAKTWFWSGSIHGICSIHDPCDWKTWGGWSQGGVACSSAAIKTFKRRQSVFTPQRNRRVITNQRTRLSGGGWRVVGGAGVCVCLWWGANAVGLNGGHLLGPSPSLPGGVEPEVAANAVARVVRHSVISLISLSTSPAPLLHLSSTSLSLHLDWSLLSGGFYLRFLIAPPTRPPSFSPHSSFFFSICPSLPRYLSSSIACNGAAECRRQGKHRSSSLTTPWRRRCYSSPFES